MGSYDDVRKGKPPTERETFHGDHSQQSTAVDMKGKRFVKLYYSIEVR